MAQKGIHIYKKSSQIFMITYLNRVEVRKGLHNRCPCIYFSLEIKTYLCKNVNVRLVQ